MRVLLLNPPERHTVQANLPEAVERLRGATPPIGLMYIAGAAREGGRYDVSFIDAHAERIDYPKLEQTIGIMRPDVVGLPVNTFTLLDAIEAVKVVRRASPESVVVAGGLQPFLYPRETAALSVFDYALQGEGERSFPKLLAAIEEWEGFERVPGILFQRGGRIVANPPPPPVENLDELPFPAHDLTPIRRYRSIVTSRRPVGIVISSRGCPFQCAFCSHSATGKRYRVRSPQNVVEEMAFCKSLGIRYLLFYDEVMTVNKERMLALCAAIQGRDLRLPWMARARVGSIDADTLAAMKRAGCELVTMGIESGSPRVLARLNRPTDTAAMIDTFRQARRAGLRTIAYFMIGNPDEKMADVQASLDIAKRARPDMVHASVFTPYPATDLYEEGRRTGRFPTDFWRAFSAEPGADFRPPLWIEPGADEMEIGRRLRWFYRRFYLRPGAILRRLFSLRGLGDLSRHLRGFRALVSSRRWGNEGE